MEFLVECARCRGPLISTMYGSTDLKQFVTILYTIYRSRNRGGGGGRLAPSLFAKIGGLRSPHLFYLLSMLIDIIIKIPLYYNI